MIDDVLTVAALRKAVRAIYDNSPGVCTHVVHPRFEGYRLAVGADEWDAVTRCAMCFQTLCLTKKARP